VLRVRARCRHAHYLAASLSLQGSERCEGCYRISSSVTHAPEADVVRQHFGADLQVLPRACSVLSLGMCRRCAHPASMCAGLGSDAAVDDMTSTSKLALHAMPGSRGKLPMTPRSATLTPRRIGLSGIAKVSSSSSPVSAACLLTPTMWCDGGDTDPVRSTCFKWLSESLLCMCTTTAPQVHAVRILKTGNTGRMCSSTWCESHAPIKCHTVYAVDSSN